MLSRRVEMKRGRRPRTVGLLPPRYRFHLNPHADVRYTGSCPECDERLGQRKLPLAVEVDQWGLITLPVVCRYCSACELLIAHQDELESQLTALFERLDPLVIGNGYRVLGSVRRDSSRHEQDEPWSSRELSAALHDFQEYVQLEPPAVRALADSARPR